MIPEIVLKTKQNVVLVKYLFEYGELSSDSLLAYINTYDIEAYEALLNKVRIHSPYLAEVIASKAPETNCILFKFDYKDCKHGLPSSSKYAKGVYPSEKSIRDRLPKISTYKRTWL